MDNAFPQKSGNAAKEPPHEAMISKRVEVYKKTEKGKLQDDPRGDILKGLPLEDGDPLSLNLDDLAIPQFSQRPG